eukprot:792639-Rhodomonas_salina.2
MAAKSAWKHGQTYKPAFEVVFRHAPPLELHFDVVLTMTNDSETQPARLRRTGSTHSEFRWVQCRFHTTAHGVKTTCTAKSHKNAREPACPVLERWVLALDFAVDLAQQRRLERKCA